MPWMTPVPCLLRKYPPFAQTEGLFAQTEGYRPKALTAGGPGGMMALQLNICLIVAMNEEFGEEFSK